LGPKHIPITKSPNPTTINKAFEQFKNSFGWQAHYYKKQYVEETYDKNLKVHKDTATYHFSRFRDPRLEQSLNIIESIIKPLSYPETPTMKDTTSDYLFKFQQNNPSTIFKNADKNIGLCLISLTDYNTMVNTHLSQSNYKLISNNLNKINLLPIFQKMKQQFRNIIKPYSINDNNQQIRRFAKYYLDYQDFKLPIFHVLPKLHKPLTSNGLPASRPIIAAINSHTTAISKLLDFKLKDLHLFSTNTLTKTADLPNILQSINLQPNTQYLLVSMDITSLYTNIDTFKLNEILSDINPELAKLSRFITNNNFFQYDYRVFKQTSGIAMGTNSAPTLANIYLSKLLDPTITNNQNILLYKRFLDDLFIIWKGNLPELLAFHRTLNELIPCIKFDLKFSERKVAFLDLEIHCQKYYTDSHNWTNHLCFGTYHKTIHTFNYISPKSMHPIHTLKGFIKGELLRFKQNSSNVHLYNHTKDKFYNNLLLRGYKRHFLDRIFNSNTYYTEQNPKSQTKILPIVIPYTLHSYIPKCKELIFDLNNRPQTTRRFIPGSKLMLSFTKKHNISQILTKSNLTQTQSSQLSKINDLHYPDEQCSTNNVWTRRHPNNAR